MSTAEHPACNPWTVVTLVMSELHREGLRPHLTTHSIAQARQAAIDLLDALDIAAEVPEAGEDS